MGFIEKMVRVWQPCGLEKSAAALVVVVAQLLQLTVGSRQQLVHPLHAHALGTEGNLPAATQ